jgi:hypothetical protein
VSWIARLIEADPRAMAQLRAARALALPDWCIAAGFVRNRVWDARHGFAPRRETGDVDLLFFDRADIGRAREEDAVSRLCLTCPDTEWEVRNQARMHIPKGLPAHRDTAHAMTFWLETPTAVGIRLDADDTLRIVAPFGVEDLVGLICRPTPWGAANRQAYEARIAAKRWRDGWPRLRFEEAQRVGTGFSPL